MGPTERQRRYRARQRNAEVVVPVLASHELVSMMTDLGWLDVGESEDRVQIGNAISRALADMAAAHRRQPPNSVTRLHTRGC